MMLPSAGMCRRRGVRIFSPAGSAYARMGRLERQGDPLELLCVLRSSGCGSGFGCAAQRAEGVLQAPRAIAAFAVRWPKAIVRAHGGEIAAHSGVAQFSVVVVSGHWNGASKIEGESQEFWQDSTALRALEPQSTRRSR